MLTIVFISCCPLLSPVGIASDLKDIHMSSPDVNMNYIRCLLFLDVSIEIVAVKQSALSFIVLLFKILFYVCLCLYFSMFFIFSFGCLIHCHCCSARCLHFVTCFNKDQSVNQSINQSINQSPWSFLKCLYSASLRRSFLFRYARQTQ